MVDFNITRAAHVEFGVTDLARARAFYVDALGFIEVDRDNETLYLGGLEERDKYSLVLRKAKSGGANHIAFRVAAAEDLEKIARLYKQHDLPTRWIEANSLESGQGKALRTHDPSGLAVEFFHEIEQRDRLLQQFDKYRGANIMRMDHFNCQVPHVQSAFDWWTQKMGFMLSESMVTDVGEHIWAAWIHRKQNVHDLALMNGIGPRLHHAGFWAQDTQSILRACDILASLDMRNCLERGPGRHGLSNAFFLYLRDHDLNRIEIYTSDYIIADPDFKPVKWPMSHPGRATFWGHQAPKSWFEEAMLLQNIHTGEFLPTQDPIEPGQPNTAH